MECQDPDARPRRFVIEVSRDASANLRIHMSEEGGPVFEFNSWEALYRYFSDRFPEWLSYLR